ncbi:hypothetical protein [Trebonia sp.]|uniref:hypothetical protein n=1 Tax=Trebonia sp. TaxID=2767075 RepID=UPI0026118AFA|nr:hypothetical protein [Trebonia sp.]
MSQWDFGTSAGGFPDDGGEDDFEAGFSPIFYERDPEAFGELWPEHPRAERPGRGARSGPLRWLVPAVIVTAAAAAAAAVVLLSGSGHPSAPGAPATPSAPAAPAAPSASAALSAEQFATYVPPRGGSGLRVVADYCGITAAN